MSGKGRLIDEFPCPYCIEGVAAIWLSPEQTRELYGVEKDYHAYRCDRCGEKFAPGVLGDGTDANLNLVQERKQKRTGAYPRLRDYGKAFGQIRMNPDVEGAEKAKSSDFKYWCKGCGSPVLKKKDGGLPGGFDCNLWTCTGQECQYREPESMIEGYTPIWVTGFRKEVECAREALGKSVDQKMLSECEKQIRRLGNSLRRLCLNDFRDLGFEQGSFNGKENDPEFVADVMLALMSNYEQRKTQRECETQIRRLGTALMVLSLDDFKRLGCEERDFPCDKDSPKRVADVMVTILKLYKKVDHRWRIENCRTNEDGSMSADVGLRIQKPARMVGTERGKCESEKTVRVEPERETDEPTTDITLPKAKDPFDHKDTDRTCPKKCGGIMMRKYMGIDGIYDIPGDKLVRLFKCNKCGESKEMFLTRQEAEADPTGKTITTVAKE